ATQGYTLVRFAQNQFPGTATFTHSIYCRSGDTRGTTDYKHLDNGSWYIQEASNITSNVLGDIPSDATRTIVMYNRDFANGGSTMGIDNSTGQCLAAGSGPDDFWGTSPGYPTDKCYVGITGKILTSPNNCEGSSTFFGVTRTGFTSLQLDPSHPWVFSTVNTLNSPLPSDEIKLRAMPKGSVIGLVWEVTPEREYVLGYELERSMDALTFHRIAQVDKQGRVTYTHDDAYVERGVRYFYRVAQHDALGMVRYSNIAEAILLPSSSQFSYQLYPNPTSGEAYLLVNLPQAGELGFQVYDAIGKLVLRESYTLSAGTHQLSLQEKLAPVASGNYNAFITYGGETFTTRLVKVDRTGQ
ncbi:MAG: T9SS type A sorting domain-containing protein, partial [Bacteroidia bacterium]